MKRALVLAIVCALGLGMCAVGQVSTGIGMGWYAGEIWTGLGVSVQGGSPIALGADLYFTNLFAFPGEEWELGADLWFDTTLNIRWPGPVDGPTLDFLFGFGSPGAILVGFDYSGVDLNHFGPVIGFSWEIPNGVGGKVLTYVLEDRIGLGLSAFFDWGSLLHPSEE